MLFEEFLGQLSDRLPFGVSLNVSPDETAVEKYEVLPGYVLNIYNDLTVAETWFGSIINELNEKKSAEAQIEIKLLAAKFKDNFDESEEFKVDNLQDALDLLFKPVKLIADLKTELEQGKKDIKAEKNPILKEILTKASEETEKKVEQYTKLLNDDEYSDFIFQNSESYQKIADLSKLVESDLAIKWMIVTFFLMSRYDGDWDFNKTARLPMSIIDKVYEFYKREANKGQDSINLELPSNEVAVPDKDEKTGKVLTEKEKEAYKLGKN